MDKSYLLEVIDLLRKSGNNQEYKLYAVVAPSISSQFSYAKLGQVISAIKELGFYKVVEAALGADMVIAVNLNGDIVGRHISPEQREPEHDPGVIGRVAAAVRRYSRTGQEDGENGMPERPGTLDTVFGAVDIMQERITRSRMAGDPPDVLLVPRVGSFSLMEFYKAEEAIRAGERCVESMRPVIEAALAR